MVITPPQSNFDHKNAHCGWCGVRFAEQKTYPRKCFRCGNDTYINPLPVTVAMLPVVIPDSSAQINRVGLLLQQRNIEPKKGYWALPGGYLDIGETWQEGMSREVREETGIVIDPTRLKLFCVDLATNNNLLIFGLYEDQLKWEDINFIPNEESTAIKVLTKPEELAFPTHTKAFTDWYNLPGPWKRL